MKVLDKGFVKLIDFMGGDLAVVQAARVSFGETAKGDERDKKLLHYLLEHGHETPFEQCIFKFHVKCPIFVARQWVRHRWSSFNEISGRYTQFEDEWYVPDRKRVQDTINKQGSTSAGITESQHTLFASIVDDMSRTAYDNYQALLNTGTAKELARIVLPHNMYTQFYWSVNARSLMNFLKLRLHTNAQFEIRRYAIAIQVEFEEQMPWTAKIFAELL